jgi:ComF family protein
MVSINNFFVNLWRLVLDLFFPPSGAVLEFLKLEDEELRKLIHIHHDRSQSIHSLFIYRTPIIRTSIQALKYHKNSAVVKRYTQILARHICAHTEKSGSSETKYILVPIPASKRRMSVQGFNQCLLLTEALIPHLDSLFIHQQDCLKRNDTQVSQTKLAKSDRLANVHGAFVASETLRGKNVVIIDDVWTTGATAHEAISACRAVGALSVTVWTIAH